MSTFYPDESATPAEQVALIRKIGKELRGVAGTNTYWMSSYCFTSRDVEVLRSCVRTILGQPEPSPLEAQEAVVATQTQLFEAQTA